MSRVLPAVLVSALLALAAAPALAANQAVSVADNLFSPSRVAVAPGESVTWTTTGGNPHSVRFEDNLHTFPSPPQPGPWTTTRTFATAGEYPFHCEIHGGPGGLGMSGVVFVNATANLPPVATLSASPDPGQTGQAVNFSGTASSDSDGTIARYEWDLDGDGSFETDTAATPTASRSYTSPGTVNVKLRVTDDDAATGQATRNLRINAAPVPPAPVPPEPAPIAAPALAAPPPAGAAAPLPPSFAASKRTIKPSKSGRFSYSFAAGSGLAGTIGFESITMVRVSARRRISLGPVQFTVPSSGIATVGVKLSRRNLTILKRNKRIKLRATVTLRNAAGIHRSGTTTLTLKSPGRR